MKGTATDKSNLSGNVSLTPSTRIVLELNQNRYVDIDQEYVDNNKATYYGSTTYRKSYYSDRFPVSSVTKPIRPQSTGTCFARYIGKANASSFPDYKLRSVKTFNNVLNSNGSTNDSYTYDSAAGTYSPKPRIYYPGPAVDYQYYTQPATQGGGWDPFVLPLLYTSQFWTNKIVIGFETTMGTPGNISIRINVSANSTPDWQTVSGTFTVNATTGQLVLYRTAGSYNAAGTWTSSKPSYDISGGYWDSSSGTVSTAGRIRGIEITASSPNGPVSLIEVAPKLVSDVSNKIIGWNWTANLAEQDSLHPVGTVSSNTGTIDLDNSQKQFAKSTLSTTVCSIAELTVPETETYGYITISGGETSEIPQFTAFAEKWVEGSDSTFNVSIRDLVAMMQEVDSPDLVVRNITPSQAIWRLLEMAGIGPIKIRHAQIPADNTGNTDNRFYYEDILPIFYSSPSNTVWSAVQSLCSDVRYAVFVDEAGVVNICTRDYLFDSNRSIDWTFRGENNGTTNFADIKTLLSEKSDAINNVTLTYKPIKPTSSGVDPDWKWRKNITSNIKPVPRQIFTENEEQVLGIAALAKNISNVFTISSISAPSGGKKTVTTYSAHGFVVDGLVKISGINTDSLNRNVKITNVTTTTFKYESTDTNTYTYGSASAQGSIGKVHDAKIKVNNQAFDYGSWGAYSGYFLIDQEIIKYDGSYFEYKDALTSARVVEVVKDELDFQRISSRAMGDIMFTGYFTGITRGLFSSNVSSHSKGLSASWVYPNNIGGSPYSEYNFQRQSDGKIDNALKINRVNAPRGTRKTTIHRVFYKPNESPAVRMPYEHYFSKIKIPHKNGEESSGGMMIWAAINSNQQVTAGIGIEITSTEGTKRVAATATRAAHNEREPHHGASWKRSHGRDEEVKIFEYKDSKIVSSTVLKAYADARDDRGHTVGFSMGTRNKVYTTWKVYMNGHLLKKIRVKNSDYPANNRSRVAFFATGKSTVYVYHVGGSSLNSAENDEDDYLLDMKEILDNTLSNRSGKTRTPDFELERFDSLVRRVYYKNVKFTSSTPAHDIKSFWAFDGDLSGDKASAAVTQTGYKIGNEELQKERNPDAPADVLYATDGEIARSISKITPTSAEIFIANITDRPVLLNGGSDGYPRISGNVVEFADKDQTSVKTDDNSINRLGLKKFEQKLSWLTSKSIADTLASHILKVGKSGIRRITIESFTNPLIQIGDCVTIQYADKDFLSADRFIVTDITSTWSTGLTHTIKMVSQGA